MRYAQIIPVLITLSAIFSARAQETYIPLNRDIYNRYEPLLERVDNNFHTSVKPYRDEAVRNAVNMDSIQNSYYTSASLLNRDTWLYRKLRKEDFLNSTGNDYSLTINPLFNFEFGRDQANSRNAAVNTRGMTLFGTIGPKFAFSSTFYENQATFINYLNTYVINNKIVPGQGSVKFNQQGFQRYDYSSATGYVSYTPNKYFSFQLGQDKNFIGDGYRSLLLSDNSFNYPFFKITTSFWHIQYTVLYAQFIDLQAAHTYDLGYQKKYGVFHYLSWNVSKRLNIGLFEAVIAQDRDSTGAYRGFDAAYYNPVIFLRPTEFAIGSPDNEMLGLNLKYKLCNNAFLYGQIVVDEFLLNDVLGRSGKGSANNKQGFQVGGKCFDIAGIPNLSAQSEFNYVRPYTYSHYTEITNYANYNQSLADPLGSNFYEWISFLTYRFKSFMVEGKFMYAIHGQDINGKNYGNDLFLPYITAVHHFDNYVGQGLRTALTYRDLRLVYIVNPRYNMNVELGISQRQETTDTYSNKNNYIYLGFRTALTNKYYDF